MSAGQRFTPKSTLTPRNPRSGTTTNTTSGFVATIDTSFYSCSTLLVGAIETYLCSHHMFLAPSGSADRTREVRCPRCAENTPSPWGDDEINERLGGMTA